VGYFYNDKVVPVPVESINLIMLGPGTTISHEAIRRIAESRCLVAWTGESGVRFYSAGYAGTYSSRNIIRQAALLSNENEKMKVIRRMYIKRFAEELPDDITLEQMRGKEGYRVRMTYKRLSEEYGVKWSGRNYDQKDWNRGDPVNRALSAANSTLYGIVHAAILASGFTPALGFIHTGKQLSFVYDIADFYKTDITIPVAFTIASQSTTEIERKVRLQLRDTFKETKLIKRIIPDIREVLFGNSDSGEDDSGPEGIDVAVCS
jgi:CRISPR-associated protein Cas1